MQANLVVMGLPMPQIVLDYSQEVQAHATGFSRCTQLQGVASHASRYNTKLNYHDYIGEIAESVGGEIAVAQYLGIKNFIPTINTFKNEADVGRRIEVKWTKYINGHLIIRQPDRINDVAVLCVGKSPVYTLVGWIPIEWAKKPRHLNNQDGNYWVAQKDLMPMHTLRSSIYGTTQD